MQQVIVEGRSGGSERMSEVIRVTPEVAIPVAKLEFRAQA
jgi:hypothetical protein